MTASAVGPEPVQKEICAWCLRVTREGDPGAPETHGICEDCTRRYFPQFAEAVLTSIKTKG